MEEATLSKINDAKEAAQNLAYLEKHLFTQQKSTGSYVGKAECACVAVNKMAVIYISCDNCDDKGWVMMNIPLYE